MEQPDLDRPLEAHDRFSIELARFLEGRVDPSRNTHPPGNPPLDVMATLAAEAELDRIFG